MPEIGLALAERHEDLEVTADALKGRKPLAVTVGENTVLVMISGRTPRVRMQSRSRNRCLFKPWGCKSALRKWHMRRGVGGCGSDAGRVR